VLLLEVNTYTMVGYISKWHVFTIWCQSFKRFRLT